MTLEPGTVDAGWRFGPGDLLDSRYRIEEPLGRGASGRVYAAFDEGAGADDPERVAIKIIGETDVRSRSALELEFSLLARMSHPNLVAALRIGVEAGRGFLVEELVEGPTLADARADLALEDYWSLTHQILEGLDHIHRRGWVHHDIKPANVLLAPAPPASPVRWQPKIADLGVASLSGSDPDGRVSGTVPFLSPERLVGKLADPRSDIWALGMTLLYCMAGTLVVNTDSVGEAARLLRSRRLPALRDLVAGAPAGLEAVIARMLARDGRTRYRDGGEALRALRAELGRAGLSVPALAIESVAQSPALVGRDLDLAAVLETLARGHQRRPRIARVRGPRGSGRTRLLREVALEVQLHGARAVFVPPGEGLLPWRAALSRLGGDPGGADPDALVDRLVEAMSARPAVLVADDVDAGGSVTAHVLDRLGPALASIAPGFLCGAVISQLEPATWQPAEPSWFADVFLEALDGEAVAELARSMLGGSIAATALAALAARSGGNPARLVDSIRQAVSGGVLVQVAGHWDLSAPLADSDQDGGDLIDGLAATDRELLLALAVLGPAGEPVSLQLCRQVTDLSWEGFSTAVAALRNRDLIRLVSAEGRAAGMLALSIAAIGRAAIARTSPDEVRRRHQRAWLALNRAPGATPAALARHALGAGLFARAVELTRSAIEEAVSRGDHAEVLELTDAETLAERAGDSDRVALRVARAEALVALSRPLEGAALAESVLDSDPSNIAAATAVARAALMAGDANRAAHGLELLRAIAPGSGRPALEVEVLEVEVGRLHRRPAEVGELARRQLQVIAALAGDPGIDDTELCRARGRVLLAGGAGLVYGGEIGDGVEMLELALELFADIDDPVHIAHVEGALAAAADLGGRDRDRNAHLERGLASAARAGADSAAARLLNIRGLDHLWRGRTASAVETLREAERRAHRAGLYKVGSVVAGNLVVVYRRAGFYGQALAAARRSLRIKASLGDAGGLTVTLLNLGDLYFEIGDYRLAAAASRRVVREAAEQGRQRYVVGGRATRALAWTKQGHFEEARAELDWIAANREGAEHHIAIEIELARATLDVERRDLVDAAERLRDVAAEAVRRDEPYFRAWALYERGVLLGEVGREDLGVAVEVAAACDARHHLWRARAQLGLALSASGDDDRAAAELARAREVLAEVLDDLPPRHRATYAGDPERRALIAAIRAQARFPEPAAGDGAHRLATTTQLDVPRDLATLLDGSVSRSSDPG